MMTGLYIHVPFCVSRCRYCDFYRMTPSKLEGPGEVFLEGLALELARLPADFAPDTVFIGGGTPTALSAGALEKMLETIARQVDLSKVIEFTSEANPGTLTKEKLAVLKAGGMNRMSIGVQTFNSRALKLLGRIHSDEEAEAAFYLLRDAGFENINLDLIQSIPGMSSDELAADVRRAVELGPEHISSYNLIYEPGTPLAQDVEAGRAVPPDEDVEADQYDAVKAQLEAAGYTHYEISNFAKPGKACLHNMLYWQGGEYFGCGPAAFSHYKGKRFGNAADLTTWHAQLKNGARPFDEVEVLSSEDKARETLVMWLRMVGGVDLKAFARSTGYDVDALCGTAIASMEEEGLLCRSATHLRLAPESLFVCNSVFSELL